MSGSTLPILETPIEVLQSRVDERTALVAQAMQQVRLAIDVHTSLCEQLWQARRDLAERESRILGPLAYNWAGVQDGLSSTEIEA